MLSIFVVNGVNSSHLHLHILFCNCNLVAAKTECLETSSSWNSWLLCSILSKLLVGVNMSKFTHWHLHLNSMQRCLTSAGIPIALAVNLWMDQQHWRKPLDLFFNYYPLNVTMHSTDMSCHSWAFFSIQHEIESLFIFERRVPRFPFANTFVILSGSSCKVINFIIIPQNGKVMSFT